MLTRPTLRKSLTSSLVLLALTGGAAIAAMGFAHPSKEAPIARAPLSKESVRAMVAGGVTKARDRAVRYEACGPNDVNKGVATDRKPDVGCITDPVSSYCVQEGSTCRIRVEGHCENLYYDAERTNFKGCYCVIPDTP